MKRLSCAVFSLFMLTFCTRVCLGGVEYVTTGFKELGYRLQCPARGLSDIDASLWRGWVFVKSNGDWYGKFYQQDNEASLYSVNTNGEVDSVDAYFHDGGLKDKMIYGKHDGSALTSVTAASLPSEYEWGTCSGTFDGQKLTDLRIDLFRNEDAVGSEDVLEHHLMFIASEMVNTNTGAAVPMNPTPADRAGGIDPDSPLMMSWSENSAYNSFVYYGTDGDADEPMDDSYLESFWRVLDVGEHLAEGKVIHWRVLQNDGAATGAVWRFNTRAMTPFEPSPAPWSTEVSPAGVTLTWECDNDFSVRQRLYWGVGQGPVEMELLHGNVSNRYVFGGPLEPDTDYSWRVDVQDIDAPNSPPLVMGPPWHFRTAPDSVPCEPFPPDGREGLSPNVDLQVTWEDNGAFNSQVYFGTTNVPPKLDEDYSTDFYRSIDSGLLEKGQTYYWQVVQNSGAVTGAVWSFNTEPFEAVNQYPPDEVTGIITSSTADVWLRWRNRNRYPVDFDVYLGRLGMGAGGAYDMQLYRSRLSTTNVQLTAIEQNRKYKWWVKTWDATHGKHDYSADGLPWTFETVRATDPGKVSVLGSATVFMPGGKSIHVSQRTRWTFDITQSMRMELGNGSVRTPYETFSGEGASIRIEGYHYNSSGLYLKTKCIPHPQIPAHRWTTHHRGGGNDEVMVSLNVAQAGFTATQQALMKFGAKEVVEVCVVNGVCYLVEASNPVGYALIAYQVAKGIWKIGDGAKDAAQLYGIVTAPAGAGGELYSNSTRTYNGCFLDWHPDPAPGRAPFAGRRSFALKAQTSAGELGELGECAIVPTESGVEVYVFSGNYQFSDPERQGTVELVPGEMSSWSEGGAPADPITFDTNSPPVERWHEPDATIPMDVTFAAFDSSTEGWTDSGSGRWAVTNGVYTMQGTGSGVTEHTLMDGAYAEYVFAADARKIEGDYRETRYGYGLYCRSDGPNNYYTLSITAAGRYRIDKRVGGALTTVVAEKTNAALRAGQVVWNTLRVEDGGGRLRFYANDTLLETVDDVTPPTGRCGLFAVDAGDSIPYDRVEFDNVWFVGDKRPAPHCVWSGGSHTHPYTNWQTAAHDIQSAVDAAGSGGRVIIRDGTYTVTTPVMINKALQVFAEDEGGNVVVDGQGAYECFFMVHTNAVVDGLTIVNGLAGDGGGVFLDRGVLRNCTVSNCVATRFGGGIRAEEGGIVDNCVVTHCSAQNGGGIYLYEGGEVRGCRVVNNHAEQDNFDHDGGGVYLREGGVVRNSTIAGNTADDNGGGLYFFREGGTSTACVVEGNRATDWGGGAYFRDGGTVVGGVLASNTAGAGGGAFLHGNGHLSGCDITRNSCERSGGGLYLYDDGRIEDCTIRGNIAGAGGGAYLQQGGVAECCTIVSNRAEVGGSSNYGGGVYIYDGGTVRGCVLLSNVAAYGGGSYVRIRGDVEHCTVVSNTVTGLGGGIRCYLGGTVRNSIVYHNEGDNCAGRGSNAVTFSYCNTTPEPSGTDVVAEHTMTGDPGFMGAGDYRLRSDSDNVDSGDYASWMAGAVDLDGNPRVLNGMVDRGAYERDPAPADSDGDGLTDAEEQRTYGTDAENPDCDYDGMTDGDEIRAGTNPWSSRSIFAVDGIRRDRASGDIVFTWPSAEGRLYSVWRAESLLSSTASLLAQHVPATPPMNTYTDSVGAVASQFYYISVEP